MRDRIIAAAIRVLRDDGAIGFTTTRVADEADISVGSLHQYFPNKHALVVAIHRDALRHGWEHVRTILDAPGPSPRAKTIEIAKWFFATESAEAAELGSIFDDIEVFLRGDAGDDDLDAEVQERFEQFVRESSTRPRTPAAARFEAQLLMTTLESVGKAIASQALTTAQRDQWATSTATMLCDYLGIA
jgi:AcrR family transcriptional regulator